MKGQGLVVITHDDYLATRLVAMLCDTLNVSGYEMESHYYNVARLRGPEGTSGWDDFLILLVYMPVIELRQMST